MKELFFSSEEKAIQHLADITDKKIIIASEIFGDTIDAVETYDMMKKHIDSILFLYDPKTKNFKKKKKPATHMQLAGRMTSDEEEQNEIIDRGVRGYYFPRLNLITFYKVGDIKRLRNPDKSILNIVMSKLKTKDDVEVKIIDDVFSVSF